MPTQTALLRLSLAVLLLAGCAGSVIARGPECTSRVNENFGISGECKRTFDSLEAESTESIGINTNDISPTVTVTYALSVESGSVSIVFDTIATGTVSKTATFGNPVGGQVRITLDAFNQLKFKVVPQDGTATGASYTIQFDCECLP